MPNKLHTKNINGNLHEAATWINKMGWADKLVTMDSNGFNTVAVFRMPAHEVYKIRNEDPSYVSAPNHDDPPRS